ncbi:MAG: hypothetical protein WC854_04350 [Bacteroidales bacterium]|nr:hypothetical protein [Bacteroidales bacterium]
MKINKYLSLVLAITLLVSCEKNKIEYNTTDIADKAEFQLHYYVPVTAVAANNITKVEINGQLFANNKAPLTTYNAIPNGAVGRFYAVDPGTVNIKMYTGTDMATLVYDQNTTLTAGKQNVFVHDFIQVPVVFSNDYPYTPNATGVTDSTAWVKFYNFLYETSGAPSGKKLQYQYIDSRTSLPVNIGQPVSFGETTGWQKVTVVKSVNISSGSRLITFKMKEVDINGVIGDLQIRGTSGSYAAYSATATLFIGRRYHHTMAGFRAVASPNSSVRIFTAL